MDVVFLIALALTALLCCLIFWEIATELTADMRWNRGRSRAHVRPVDRAERLPSRGLVESIDRRFRHRIELQRRTWVDGQLNATPKAKRPSIAFRSGA